MKVQKNTYQNIKSENQFLNTGVICMLFTILLLLLFTFPKWTCFPLAVKKMSLAFKVTQFQLSCQILHSITREHSVNTQHFPSQLVIGWLCSVVTGIQSQIHRDVTHVLFPTPSTACSIVPRKYSPGIKSLICHWYLNDTKSLGHENFLIAL